MNFTITANEIMGLCALITAIWGVWKIVKEYRKPNDDLKKRVDKHDIMLDNDNKRLKEIERSNQLILKSLYDIINHDITGNGLEKMKETRDTLNEFLIRR